MWQLAFSNLHWLAESQGPCFGASGVSHCSAAISMPQGLLLATHNFPDREDGVAFVDDFNSFSEFQKQSKILEFSAS